MQPTPVNTFLFLSTESIKIQNSERHPTFPFPFSGSEGEHYSQLHVWLPPLQTYLDKQWGHSLRGIIIPRHTVNHSDGINQILYSMGHRNLKLKDIKWIPSYIYKINNQYPIIFKSLTIHKRQTLLNAIGILDWILEQKKAISFDKYANGTQDVYRRNWVERNWYYCCLKVYSKIKY